MDSLSCIGMITLDSEIQLVKGVGPKVAKYLNKCGITSLESLFYYFPREYDDRRKLPDISELKLNQQVTLVGQIDSIHEKKVNARISVLECSISDRSGSVTAVWFNQGYLKNVLKIQKKVVLKGKVERNLFSATTKLIVSETEVIYSDQDYKESVGLVIPIYNLQLTLA